jgi:hypothetical protein
MVKLTYEQMRHLAELGDGGGKMPIKNRKGVTLKPTLKKWQSQTKMEIGSTSSEVPQKQHHVLSAIPSRICQPASSSQRPQLRAKR